MKLIIKPFIYGCIAVAGYIHSAQAQDLAIAGKVHQDAPSHFSTITTDAPASGKLVAVNTKVLRLFFKSYENAENIKWYKDGNGYLAMFDWNGVKAHASFGKDGYWYYTVRFGTEKALPAAVRTLIKSSYVDYTIGKATEVTVGSQKAWVVNLEDANNLVLVRVMDGGLDELAHYNTSPQAKKHTTASIGVPHE